MDDKKTNEGVSVKEIENFAKKHRYEVFLCLAFLLSGIFGSAIYSMMWMISATVIGGVIGVLLAQKVANLSKSIMQFIFKQETTTQLVLGIVLLIVAIFLAPLIFLLLAGDRNIGMHVELGCHQLRRDDIEIIQRTEFHDELIEGRLLLIPEGIPLFILLRLFNRG